MRERKKKGSHSAEPFRQNPRLFLSKESNFSDVSEIFAASIIGHKITALFLHLEDRHNNPHSILFECPEDGSTKFHQNVGNYLPDQTVSHSKSQYSS
jgi:hypothetical protein